MATYVDIGLAVAEADPSMGWITTFYMEHNWLLTMFAEELQDEIFGAQPFVLAPGSVNPSGRAVPTGDGTFTLSGHWTVRHRHLPRRLGAAEREDRGRRDRTRPAASCCPVDEVEVKDTWHVDGMAATGSRDIVATDVVVPERRVSLDAAAARARQAGRPVPRTASRSRRSSRSPPPCPRSAPPSERSSCSRTACSTACMFGTKRTQSARVPTQVRLANLRVEVDFAETLLRDIADRMQAHADGRDRPRPAGPAAPAPRASPTSCAGAATSSARSSQSSGASVHYLDNELQRIHRDVHMICAHTVFDVDLVAEGVGRQIVASKEPPAAT